MEFAEILLGALVMVLWGIPVLSMVFFLPLMVIDDFLYRRKTIKGINDVLEYIFMAIISIITILIVAVIPVLNWNYLIDEFIGDQ